MQLRWIPVLWLAVCGYGWSDGLESPGDKPLPVPSHWAGLIGKYADHGADFLILEDNRQLFLLRDSTYHALAEVSEHIYALSLPEETLDFTRDAGVTVRLQGTAYRKIPTCRDRGVPFRIEPVAPIEALQQLALAAVPPREDGLLPPDLVDLARLESTLRFDIRYATADNFIGRPVYPSPGAFLQRPAAEALLRAHAKARQWNYGFLVFDAYRPWYVTKIFWDATPAEKKDFVADPATGSRHNRGAAVDLTLYDLATGDPVDMTSDYDEFSEAASANYPGGTSLQRWHGRLLRFLMQEQGFTCEPCEWWHFDYREWRKYPIGNATFAELTAGE